ncbi:hypothetical protein ACFL40_01155 [candidate division KSB1 bacterium]
MKRFINKLFKHKYKIFTVVLCVLSVGPNLTSTQTCTPVML